MLETLASTSPNPLSAVIVQRLVDPSSLRPSSCLVIRRRSIGGGMRDEHRGAPDLVGGRLSSTSS